jgi:hypothetical protein
MELSGEEELERFKSDIHLAEYARERYGFEYDEERSTDRAKVLGDGTDKIVVGRGDDGHWQYFNVHDSSDRGSVIDFVQNREGSNLGEVRKELRGVHGATPQPSGSISTRTDVSTSEPDRDPVETVPDLDNVRNWAEFSHMDPVVDHPYLTEDREIDESIIQDGRFPIATYVNENGIENVVYPHVNSEGELTGYQEKGRGDYERFAEGTTKAMWRSRLPDPDEPADNVIVTESVEDTLAYEQANRPEGNVRYVAISGQASDYGIEQAQKQIEKDNPDRVTFATDPDDQGQKYDKQIGEGISSDRDVYTHKPDNGRDWNDELQHQLEQERNQGPELTR